MVNYNEQTYIMVKPDGVQRNLVGTIMHRFEKRGFQLVALKMELPSKALLDTHYKDFADMPFFPALIKYMLSGPVVCMVWQGYEAVKIGRALLGATNPKDSLPGTIRGDFCQVAGQNVVHGSDGVESAQREISLWFKPEELVQFKMCNEEWIQNLTVKKIIMDRYTSLIEASFILSTTIKSSAIHEFPFGEIAEIIDTLRTSGARQLKISTDQNMLYILDVRKGRLACEEKSEPITFTNATIGQYTKGLLLPALRIGKAVLFFTKTKEELTCLLTFHEEEKIDKVVILLLAFSTTDRSPLADTEEDVARHKLEMDLIIKYSPFKSQEDLLAQFDKFNEGTGTLCVIYNLKILDNGEAEFDILTDDQEIYWTDKRCIPERQSLRKYLAILYLSPQIKIDLRGRKVQTKRIIENLVMPRKMNYKFTQAGELPAIFFVTFYFGFINQYWPCDGIYMYSGSGADSRLIKMNVKFPSVEEHSGLIGIVEVPAKLLTTTENKQDFSNTADVEAIVNIMDADIIHYRTDLWNMLDSQYPRHVRKTDADSNYKRGELYKLFYKPSARNTLWKKDKVTQTIQCDGCRRRRPIPAGLTLENIPDTWQCSDHPTTTTCNDPEADFDKQIRLFKHKKF